MALSEQLLTSPEDAQGRRLIASGLDWSDYSEGQKAVIDEYIQRCLANVGLGNMTFAECRFAENLFERSKAMMAEPSTPAYSNLSQITSLPGTPSGLPRHLVLAKMAETREAWNEHQRQLSQNGPAPGLGVSVGQAGTGTATQVPVYGLEQKAKNETANQNPEPEPQQHQVASRARQLLQPLSPGNFDRLRDSLVLPRLPLTGRRPTESTSTPLNMAPALAQVPAATLFPQLASTPIQERPLRITPASDQVTAETREAKLQALKDIGTNLDALTEEHRKTQLAWQTAMNEALELEIRTAKISYRAAELEREYNRHLAELYGQEEGEADGTDGESEGEDEDDGKGKERMRIRKRGQKKGKKL